MNMMTGIPMPPTTAPKPPIALLRALPAAPLAKKYQRLKRLADMFAAFDRDDMELAVELLLAEMDAADGDPDVEPNGDEADYSAGIHISEVPTDWLPSHYLPEHRDAAIALADEDVELNGDELDHGGGEDEFVEHRADGTPGCAVSDPDLDIDDVGELDGLENGESTSAETDGGKQGEPGFYFTDDHNEPDGADIRRRHRDRIRRTRCDVEVIRGYGWTQENYRLRDRVSA